MKPGVNPLILVGFVAAAVAMAVWLIFDTVKAMKSGQARFAWFIDNRAKNPGGFWFNIAFRFLLIAIFLATSAILIFD